MNRSALQDESDSTADATPPPWRRAGIWPVSVAMALLAGAAIAWVLPNTAVPGAPTEVHWLLLAVGFAVAESTIVHIPINREAHTISLSEIPLLLGMVFAAPVTLLLGRLAGAAAALLFYRRQRPYKLAFNLGLFSLETVTAVAIFRWLLGSGDASSPVGWASALAGVGVAIVVSASTVNLAIAILDGNRRFFAELHSFASGLLISIGTAFVGVLCYLTVWNDPRSTVVLVGAAAMMFVLLRVYGSLTQRHDDLRAVYSFANATNAHVAVRDVTAASLGEVVRLLRAEQATVLFADDAGDIHSITMTDGGDTREGAGEPDHLNALLLAANGPRHERMFGPRATELRHYYAGTRRPCALLSPMAMSGPTNGVLVAAGRVGPDRDFSVEDLDLLDALASHSAVTLGRALMVERLTEELDAKQAIISSKDQLIAAVSHELRTPLTGILGFSEIMRDEGQHLPASDRQAMLRSIAADALDMSNLVEDLLTAARAQMGLLAIEAVEVSLRDLVDSVVEHSTNLSLSITVTGDSADAVVDPTRVRQILRNLIVNADRYGGRRLRVTVATRGDTSVVRVSDDGAGIPPDKRELVFVPYESAHRSATQPGSLGLGLSISRTLARMMGGDLTYSYAGGWSTFEMRLPRAPVSLPALAAEPRRPAEPIESLSA